MRILAIDPGEKHIGLALSDPTGLVARPLSTLAHETRDKDAARIAALAAEHQAEMILVGLALDAEDHIGPQARKGERLAAAIRSVTPLPVIVHDESHTTTKAELALRARGKRRREQIHAAAAAALLQSYLDARSRDDQTA
jgi:putative Holliday junction resolvase